MTFGFIEFVQNCETLTGSAKATLAKVLAELLADFFALIGSMHETIFSASAL